MAVQASDLLAPNGPVEKSLFPGESSTTDDTDIAVRIEAYISEAEDKVSAAGVSAANEDEAVKAWALHLTFKAAYILASTTPTKVDAQVEIIGSREFAEDQRKALRNIADEYRDEYFDIVARDADGKQYSTSGGSRQTKNVFDW